MKLCSVIDCNTKHHAKGNCQKHYDQTLKRKAYKHPPNSKESVQRGINKRRKQNKELKIKLLKIYGKICKCCGESNTKFLTLQHTLNNGGKLRKGGQIKAWELAIKTFDPTLEILCFNCNIGTYQNKGICPHKE